MESKVCDIVCEASHCDNALAGDNIKGWNAEGGYCDYCWRLG